MRLERAGKKLRITREIVWDTDHKKHKEMLMQHMDEVFDIVQVETGKSILELEYQLTIINLSHAMQVEINFMTSPYERPTAETPAFTWEEEGRLTINPNATILADNVPRYTHIPRRAGTLPNRDEIERLANMAEAVPTPETRFVEDIVREMRDPIEDFNDAITVPTPRPTGGWTPQEEEFIRREMERLAEQDSESEDDDDADWTGFDAFLED